jgi:hypothetical protein
MSSSKRRIWEEASYRDERLQFTRLWSCVWPRRIEEVEGTAAMARAALVSGLATRLLAVAGRPATDLLPAYQLLYHAAAAGGSSAKCGGGPIQAAVTSSVLAATLAALLGTRGAVEVAESVLQGPTLDSQLQVGC